MKVLYWLEPLADVAHPGAMQGWLQWFSRIDTGLRNSLEGYESLLVAHDSELSQQSRFAGGSLFLSQAELRLDWSLAGDLRVTLGRAPAAAPHCVRWGEWFRQRLAGFEPDVVFLLSESAWLRRTLPTAHFINLEVGWIFREPYPSLWQIDPVGFGKGRFLATHWDTIIDSVTLGVEGHEFLTEFRKEAQRKVHSDHARDYVANLRTKWRRVALLPLAENYALDGITPMLAAMDYWFDRFACPETLYLLTQHPLDKALNPVELGSLAQRNNNLHSVEIDSGLNTQMLMPWMDEVIADFSSVAVQGLLFGVKTRSIAELPFADQVFANRNPLSKPLAAAEPADCDKALYWLLTHFSLQEDQLFDGVWMSRFIQRLCAMANDDQRIHLFETATIPIERWLSDPWMHAARSTEGGAAINPDGAHTHKQRMVPRFNSDRDAYQAAAALVNSGKVTDGIQALIGLASMNSQWWAVYNDLGMHALAQGLVDDAVNLLSAAVEREPSPATASINLARVQFARGNREEALCHYGRVLRENMEAAEVLAEMRAVLSDYPEIPPVVWAKVVADLRSSKV